jgi:hypothetical protein
LARKVVGASIPIAAVCHRYDRSELLAPWSAFVELLGRWHQMLNDPAVWQSLWVTVLFTLMSTPPLVAIALVMALLTMGVATILVPVLALVLVYLFVIAMCRGVLRRVRKIQVVNALVHGSTLDERQTTRRAKRQARRVRRTSLEPGPDFLGAPTHGCSIRRCAFGIPLRLPG